MVHVPFLPSRRGSIVQLFLLISRPFPEGLSSPVHTHTHTYTHMSSHTALLSHAELESVCLLPLSPSARGVQ